MTKTKHIVMSLNSDRIGVLRKGDEKMNYLAEAKELMDDLVKWRRHLHENPEVGFELPKTSQFVKGKLEEFGYEPEYLLEHGLIAEVGQGEKTILLRADMDGLPIEEQSGLDFASTNDYSHTCGHDMHTTIMLGVAKLMKEHEDELEGVVRFEFQPAEELLIGSEAMVEAGLLEGVDAALAAHVQPMAPASIMFKEGVSLAAANNYRIKVKGVGSHGAMPHNGIDPVFIASQIINATQSLVAREVSFDKSAAITTGGFDSPGSRNTIPNEVTIEGTMRTFSEETRDYLKERLPELAEGIAKAYRAEIEFDYLCDIPVLDNNPELTQSVRGFAEDVLGDEVEVTDFEPLQASEDFAVVSAKVPTTYFFIGTKPEGAEGHPVHHPEVVFNEDMMAPAVAVFLNSTINWLKENN